MRLFVWDAGDGKMLERGETDGLKYGKEAAAGPNQISLDWRGGGGAGLVISSSFFWGYVPPPRALGLQSKLPT